MSLVHLQPQGTHPCSCGCLGAWKHRRRPMPSPSTIDTHLPFLLPSCIRMILVVSLWPPCGVCSPFLFVKPCLLLVIPDPVWYPLLSLYHDLPLALPLLTSSCPCPSTRILAYDHQACLSRPLPIPAVLYPSSKAPSLSPRLASDIGRGSLAHSSFSRHCGHRCFSGH